MTAPESLARSISAAPSRRWRLPRNVGRHATIRFGRCFAGARPTHGGGRARHAIQMVGGDDDTVGMPRSAPRLGGRAWLVVLAVLVTILAAGCYYTPEQQRVLAQINQSRAAAGRPPVAMNLQMATNAQRWAEHLAATGRLEHTTRLREETPAGSSWGAENVGGPAQSLESVHRSFLNSPPHRANMLSRANLAGTGVARDRYGRLWVVHRFAICCPYRTSG